MAERFQQDGAVEAAPLEDEVILVRPEAHQFFILNRTASVIWSRVEQPATVAEIAAELSSRFADVDAAQATDDVEETIRDMLERQLVCKA